MITRADGTVVKRYQANNPGPDAPLGYGDEDLVRQVLDRQIDLPEDATPHGQETTIGRTQDDWLMVGPVVVQGELKALLGGVPGEASCPGPPCIISVSKDTAAPLWHRSAAWSASS